jgi:hypothetical protein
MRAMSMALVLSPVSRDTARSTDHILGIPAGLIPRRWHFLPFDLLTAEGKPAQMKTHLIVPLALATSVANNQFTLNASPDRAAAPKALGADAEHGIDFVRGGVNVFDYLSPQQRDDVRSCRLASDVTFGIQAAVGAAAASTSGRVVLPDGCYRTTATITLPSDIELVGASMRATKIVPGGNFPAISAIGTYAHGLTGVGVQNMSVVCAGMSNANAMGVRMVYVNRGKLRDLYFNGCYHALDLYDQWQTSIDNVTADGRGTQQNKVGVYMGPPTDVANKAPNNAVIMSNSTMQNVEQYGYELVYFAGSKFINDEAMNGVTGWKLCGESYIISSQACQFGHFANIVADTTTGPGIVVDQGVNANPANNIMFDHVWIGSSIGRALYLAGVTYSQFDKIHITRADNGVYLHNSNNVKISTNVADYNNGNNKSYAVVIDGGADNTVWATNNQSKYPTGYNGISEIGPYHGNSIWGGVSTCDPKLAFGDGSRGKEGLTYAVRSCQYEVQGRQVRMTFRLSPSSLGSYAGAAVLNALPFATDAGEGQDGAVGAVLASGMSGVKGTIILQVVPGDAAAKLYSQGEAGPVALTRGNFSSTSTISGNLEYTKK